MAFNLEKRELELFDVLVNDQVFVIIISIEINENR